MSQMEAILSETLRSGDVLARYSDSQFVVLLPACTCESCQLVAGRVRERFQTCSMKPHVQVRTDCEELMWEGDNTAGKAVRGDYFPLNMLRVCVEQRSDDISGRIVSPLLSEELPFFGLVDLLLKMDKLFDAAGYPQAFQKKRSLAAKEESGNAYRGRPKARMDPERIGEQHGRQGTFDILVSSRRNAGWQGRVYGEDGRMCGAFDGELDLLALLVGQKTD